MELVDFKEHEEDFIWDYKLHFPIPTLNYITIRTGEDLLKTFSTKLEAQGKVLALTRSAKQFLFSTRVDERAWEYYMAHDLDLIYEVLEYVLEFINFAFITGEYIDYFKMTTSIQRNVGLNNAKHNLLGARKLLPYGVKDRVGY